ncbi:asparagine synthase-related protein [Acidobacteriia bacterium AH_259_A11_L15]|nr:asparagine synthase-related protein [Acidobacteriia bacterium AH_259_A11_L15]
MCGIAGVFHPRPNETASHLRELLAAMQHRGPDGAGMAIGRQVRTGWTLEEVQTDALRGTTGLGHTRLAIVGGRHGLQPFQSRDGRLLLLHNGEIYNHHELRRSLPEKVNFETKTDSEVILRLLEREYQGDLLAALRRVLPHLDGVYAVAVSDGERLIIARDPMGVRQLYVGKNGKTFAFASEKKALQATGIQEPIERLEPGHLAWVRNGSWEQENFARMDLRRIPADVTEKEEALKLYQDTLHQALYKRIRDRDRVGVIFSGGIDSVLVAYLLKQFGLPFTCYSAGFCGSPDLDFARRMVAQFDFPLQSRDLGLDDIEDLLPLIMQTIEDRSLNQVEVSVPVFASVRLASEAGERVLFTGQGADELFGGYSWYPRIVDREGYDSFVEYEISDIEHLYKETLEREDKITMAHSIELRVPYLDLKLVHAALRVDPRLKIQPGGDPLGKRVHRQLAVRLGIPPDFAWRPKQAAQHGAGIHEAIQELAARAHYTQEDVRETGYRAQESIPEVLGSSSRYGYRYGEDKLWKTEDHVQCYLDSLAWKAGLLTPPEQEYLVPKLESLATV